MPDLADQFRRIADAAARDARPLPAAEVISRGDRRRRRRAFGVLAGAAAAIAVVAITVMAGTGLPGRPAAPGLGATPGGCTEQATLTAADGHITACVSYRYQPGGVLQVRGIQAAFTSSAGYAIPYFTFTFANPNTGAVGYQFSTTAVESNTVRSHDTGLIPLGNRPAAQSIRPGDILKVTLSAENPHNAKIYPVATLTLTMNRHGLTPPR